MIKPQGSNILVRRAAAESVTKGGIMIPEANQKAPQEGTVLAVGEGKRTRDGVLVPLEVAFGDTVVFSKYGGTEIKVDGETLLILDENQILGVLTR